MSSLETLGWGAPFSASLGLEASGLSPARVLEVQRSGMRVGTDRGEFFAEAAGRLHRELEQQQTKIAAGDWVAGTFSGDLFWISSLLPRKTLLTRSSPKTGKTETLAANCDELWILSSCNQDFSLERVERYVAMGWEGGAQPVVVVTKADLADAAALAAEASERLLGVPVLSVSSASGEGIAELEARLVRGKTAAIMGSSGVGKSTLVNRLIGSERQSTGGIREEDAKGRHTTTVRSLLLTPGGACLIDTPGLRELSLAAGNELGAFEEIEALALQCRFSDCAHGGEPGCAVQAALMEGSLSEDRYANYGKLLREQAHTERKHNKAALSAERKRWKKISQLARSQGAGK